MPRPAGHRAEVAHGEPPERAAVATRTTDKYCLMQTLSIADLDRALASFAVSGPDAMTVREIAAAAGVPLAVVVHTMGPSMVYGRRWTRMSPVGSTRTASSTPSKAPVPLRTAPRLVVSTARGRRGGRTGRRRRLAVARGTAHGRRPCGARTRDLAGGHRRRPRPLRARGRW